MSTYEDRLAALREQLKADRLDGFVVPLTDEHMSEYVGSYAQRLAWLTGFQGSAGSAVVLPEEAAIFVDGRYTLQVRDQVDGKHWSYQSVPRDQHRRLAEGACAGRRPDRLRSLAAHQGLGERRRARRWPTRAPSWSRSASNPIDAVWADQPEPSRARLIVHPDEYAGKSLGRQAPGDGRLAEGAEGRRGGARRARFDRLDVQRARQGRRAHAGRPVLRAGPRRRHRRPVRRLGEDRRRRPPASRQRRARPRAQRLRAGARRRSPARPSRSIPSARSRRSSRRSTRPAPRSSPSAIPRSCPRRSRTRSRSPATGPPRRATARRCRASSTGCRSRRRRAASTSSSAAAKLQEFRQAGRRPPRPQLRHHLRRRARTARSSITGSARRPTGRSRWIRSIWSIRGGQYPDGTTDVTRTVVDRHADRGDEGPLHPRPQGPYRASPAPSSRTARAASQLDSFARQYPVAGRARLRPRHRPRRRQLPVGPRGAAAHLAGRQRPGRRRRAAARPA